MSLEISFEVNLDLINLLVMFWKWKNVIYRNKMNQFFSLNNFFAINWQEKGWHSCLYLYLIV